MRFTFKCPGCGVVFTNVVSARDHICPPGSTPPKQPIPELPARHSKFGAYTSAEICSCEGVTPNCIYCDGTGLISKDVRQRKDDIQAHGTATIDFGYIPASDEEPRLIPGTRAVANIPDEDVSPETTSAYERPGDVTRMDKLRNYGYPCREEGRYGSHPSHDGFDDESKP